MIDVHSHILPALDDGVKTLEDAVTVVKGLAGLGFTHIVATPHFYPGKYTPSVPAIDAALSTLKAELKKQKVATQILRGRECFFDFELTTSSDRDSFPFVWNQKKYILIELPQMTQAQFMAGYVRALLNVGITPILAHPERYERVISKPERIEEYKSMGFKIQVDLMNLLPTAKEGLRTTAHYLFEQGHIDLFATDVHKPEQLERITQGMNWLKAQTGNESISKYFSL